jgi:DNA oxidative demethylase
MSSDTGDLFSPEAERQSGTEVLGEGAALLRGYVADEIETLFGTLCDIVAQAPFRHLITPGGHRMSVAMTNCGSVGWVSDRRGYRYDPVDPDTGRPWPPLPDMFLALAARAAAECGFDNFVPDACLINRYEPGSRLTLHQDRNELGTVEPIVSVSLGLPATFLFGGLSRKDRPRRYPVTSGDVAVFGGPSRMVFHGVAPVAKGDDPLTGSYRFNLTFRKAL